MAQRVPAEAELFFCYCDCTKALQMFHFVRNDRKKREPETDKDAQRISELNEKETHS